MDFSELYRQTGNLCQVSPDNQFIATAFEHRLVVRDTQTQQIACIFNQPLSSSQPAAGGGSGNAAATKPGSKSVATPLSKEASGGWMIEDLQWCSDSLHILTANYKRGVVYVWSLAESTKWIAKIDQSMTSGISYARWLPSGCHIYTVCDCQIRLTIYSLSTGESWYIAYPKFRDKGVSVSPDARFLAVLERREHKDCVGIYGCVDWKQKTFFYVDAVDAESLAWSPDGHYIAVWDNVTECRLLIYTPNGTLKKSFAPYSTGLGIKTASWAPSGLFIVIGCYDQKMRFLNRLTWTPLATLRHPTTLSVPGMAVYDEVQASSEAPPAMTGPRRYDVSYQNASLSTFYADPSKPNPKVGIGFLEFDADGGMLCTRSDNMGHVLWIWEVAALRPVALLHQLLPTKMVRWNPVYPGYLAFTCGTSHVYYWHRDLGCECIEVPAVNFSVSNFRWSPNGQALLLMDREHELWTLAVPALALKDSETQS